MASAVLTRICKGFALSLAIAATATATATEAPSIEEGRSFWAFQAVNAPSVPDGAGHPIDVLAGGDAPGLPPVRLVRKLYLDLHGLPPTFGQIASFVEDPSEEAYLALVDELLASRRFGERWGRHWLGVVRYADSTGGGRAILLNDAWRYRDYVIDSFHRDRPFDDFVNQQLAGDLLEHSDAMERRDAITATGFLALGPTNYELQDKNQLRMDVVDEQIDTVGRAFMGMSLGCARCHDHFFDPIPTADYYALAGIFRSTKTLEHSNVSKWISTKLPPSGETELAAQRERDEWNRHSTQLRDRIGALKETLKNQASARSPGIVVDDRDALLEGAWTDSTFAKGYFGDRYIHDAGNQTGQRAVFRQTLPKAGEYEVRVAYTALGNRTSIAIATVQHADGEAAVRFDQREPAPLDGFRSLGAFRFGTEKPADVVLTNGSTGAGVLIVDAVAFVPVEGGESEPIRNEANESDQAELARLEAELKQLGKQKPPGASVAMSVVDEAKPTNHAINVGGNTMNLGAEVPRGFLSVASLPGASRPSIPDGQSGRRELAHWLTSPDHPLLARVYVNRIWHWLSGEGIVATPNDFGSTGQPPSNPPLLDYLAEFLIENDFSTKALARFIVSSSTYRTANKSPRRIDAESIRDAMLLVSGELDLAHTSGPAIKAGTNSEFGYRFDSTHRSVFAPVFRNNLPELFQVFDFPDPSLSSGSRSDTTLATQALYMMNHPWVIARSEAAAKRWLQVGESPEAIVRAAYQATLSRPPDDSELALSLNFLGGSPNMEKVTQFQQSLFASIDFRHY